MPFASPRLWILLPAFLWTSEAAAQAGVVAGRISVRQLPDSAVVAPARSATVSIVGTSLAAITDADGHFAIALVPAGPATLRVRLLGHRTIERFVRVTAGDTTRFDVTLDAEAQMLAPVRADAPSAEVELFRTRPAVAVTVLSAASMKGVPSLGEPDVVRVAQLLPGVVARNDFSTGLNVRGGEADQNLVLLDGFPIYNPFHFGGVFSTFMDATVGGVELITAAFPAHFGGRLSSVLDVQSADETRPGVNTTADISALGATARLSGLFPNARGAWSLAGRHTYADAVTSIFTDNIFPYHFRDLHAHVTYQLPGDVRLAVTAYDGRDVLDANLAAFDTDTAATRANQGSWQFNWGNRVIGAAVAKDFGGRVTLEQRAWTSGFSTRLDLGNGAATQRNSVTDYTLAGAFALHASSHEPSVGYELTRHRIRYSSGSDETGTTEFDIRQEPFSGAAWVEDLWRVSPRWLVQTGLRAEALSGSGWAALSPRVSVKFFARPELAFTVAAGRVTQFMQSLAGDGPLRYFDVWLASDSLTPVSTAWQWVAGAERRFGDTGSLRLEGYVKRYDRVLEANWSEDPQVRGDEFLVAQGLSYGAELLARWQMGRDGPHGWVAYSYGLARRTRDGASWAPGHDRRHDLDVVATWRVARYQIGARLGLASGTPYTPIVGEIARWAYDPSSDTWNGGVYRIGLEPVGGTRNGARYPITQRLDVDVSREFATHGAAVTPYLSVVNAYNAQNVFAYFYDYSTLPATRRAVSQFPIIPSVGVRLAF